MKNIFLKLKRPKVLSMSKGFTLVEVMIALGLFTVVMIVGIGAILGVSSTHRKSQSMRAVIDNLSFLMEDMARSIRLGQDIYCKQSAGAPDALDLAPGGGPQVGQDGDNCKSIAFEPYWQPDPNTPDNQVVYYITESDGIGTIFKKENNMSFSDAMLATTSEEIHIDVDKSGFSVTGADPTDPVTAQPRVTIILIGTIKFGTVETEFNLQTTVSQRRLDIDAFN